MPVLAKMGCVAIKIIRKSQLNYNTPYPDDKKLFPFVLNNECRSYDTLG